jgi:hypothetical protein
VFRSSKSRDAIETSAAHCWLEEFVYAPKRARTVDLVNRAIEDLQRQRQPISLASIANKSKTVDPSGRGVSESAILGNSEARAIYKQQRSWKGNRRTGSPRHAPLPSRMPAKVDRDTSRARSRYLSMTKAELVDRLLIVEREYAEQRERWLGQQDEVLLWRLRAQQAEVSLERAKQANVR